MNILDPLRQHNNIGRSVSQASFYRIQRAFQKGHAVMSDILTVRFGNHAPRCDFSFCAHSRVCVHIHVNAFVY